MKVTLLSAHASDLDVVNAARVSFADRAEEFVCDLCHGTGKIPDPDRGSGWGPYWDEPCKCGGRHLFERDEGLIGFLIRNRHGTPFEHGYFRFHVEAPIFVFREWHRHRIGHSYNEMSARYTKMEKRFYEPDSFRTQHGKPGAYTFEESGPSQEFADRMAHAYETAWAAYETLLEAGVAKEQARAVLPVGLYSQQYWSCNPRSLMHFLGLRNAPTALKEIRVLAAQAEEALEKHMPVTHRAFVDNERQAP